MKTTLYEELVDFSESIDRSKSWVVRQAVARYLEEETEQHARTAAKVAEAEQAAEADRLARELADACEPEPVEEILA